MEAVLSPSFKEIQPIFPSFLPQSFSGVGLCFRFDRRNYNDVLVALPRSLASRRKCSGRHFETCKMSTLNYVLQVEELPSIRSSEVQDKQTTMLQGKGISRRNVLQRALAVWGSAIDGTYQIGTKALAAEEDIAITRKVFFDIAVDGQPLGEVVVGLYGTEVPVGAQRFAELAIGQRGIGYSRKEFGKITPSYIQNNGLRSFSLSGGATNAAKFTGGDSNKSLVTEKAELREKRSQLKNVAGAVSLFVIDPAKPPAKTKLVAKNGKFIVLEEESRPDPNGTEFMFVTADSPELDLSNLVVGRVVEGYEVIKKIAATKVVNENSSSLYFKTAKLIGDSRAVVAERGFYRPYSKIVITKSGEITSMASD